MKCALCGKEYEPEELTGGVCHCCAVSWFSVKEAMEFLVQKSLERKFIEWRYNFSLDDVKNDEELFNDLWNMFFGEKYSKENEEIIYEFCFESDYKEEWFKYLKEFYE